MHILVIDLQSSTQVNFNWDGKQSSSTGVGLINHRGGCGGSGGSGDSSSGSGGRGGRGGSSGSGGSGGRRGASTYHLCQSDARPWQHMYPFVSSFALTTVPARSPLSAPRGRYGVDTSDGTARGCVAQARHVGPGPRGRSPAASTKLIF